MRDRLTNLLILFPIPKSTFVQDSELIINSILSRNSRKESYIETISANSKSLWARILKFQSNRLLGACEYLFRHCLRVLIPIRNSDDPNNILA